MRNSLVAEEALALAELLREGLVLDIVEHELGVGDDGVPFDLGKLVWRSRERERERERESERARESE